MQLPTISFDCQRTCPSYDAKIGGLYLCRFMPIMRRIGATVVHSHVARVKADIIDLDALEMAAQRCGLIFNRGQQTYRWFGEYVGDTPLPDGYTHDMLGKCQHALSLPFKMGDINRRGSELPYEVGVVARPDGSGYDLLWDFWEGGFGLEKAVGENCQLLAGEYVHAVAEKAAVQLGWMVERTNGLLIVHHPSGGVLTLSQTGDLETSGFQGAGCHQARLDLGLPVVDGSIIETGECASVAARVQLPTG